MKKVLLTALITFAYSGAFAQSAEEACYNSAEADVKLHTFFNETSDGFDRYITIIDKSNHPLSVKTRLREKAYWVKNRIDMQANDIRRLSFLNCIVKFK